SLRRPHHQRSPRAVRAAVWIRLGHAQLQDVDSRRLRHDVHAPAHRHVYQQRLQQPTVLPRRDPQPAVVFGAGRHGSALVAAVAHPWPKSIDNGSSDRDATDVPPDSRNARAERGVSNYDRTHIFTGNFIYMLPAPFRSPLVRGWQLSGIVRMWTGRPFDVVMSADVAQIGAVQNQRPDVIADSAGPKTVEQW